MMTSYDWRRFWQPQTRGGFEVVDVRPQVDGDMWVCWYAGGGYDYTYVCPSGKYHDEQIDRRDLLPVEQPAEQPEDTNGDFKCPSCGGSHFGRPTTRTPDGGVKVLDTVRCHDEHGTGCTWAGLWVDGFMRDKSAVTIATLTAERDRLRDALTRIEKWFGEFPPTGRFWTDKETDPMSYGEAYGSNGERDFMRQVARDALNPPTESEAAS